MIDTEKMVFVNHRMMQHLFADANAKVLTNDIEKIQKDAENKGEEMNQEEIFHYVTLLTIHISEVQKIITDELFKEKEEE